MMKNAYLAISCVFLLSLAPWDHAAPEPEAVVEAPSVSDAPDVSEPGEIPETTAVETSGENPVGTIEWIDYEKGVARGKQNGKKVFLNFYAEWCQYCKVMDQSTFRDASVVAYLNENFIPVRVDSDKRKNLARNYNVSALPVSWFIAEDGENIGSQPGYVPPEMMLPLLKYIHTDSYKRMDFKKFMDGL